jgi:tetratricopeptide (TPR) repeat protein
MDTKEDTKEDAGVNPRPVEPPSVEVPDLPRDARVDRFFVGEKLGAGGMGVVYAAYDPELGRKVALKLLLPRSGGAGDGDRTRLVREAQALAKLSHPNVVAVHDAGTRDDRVWIAMEFVAGQTLTVWAKERPRRWAEVLALLTDVARGLAAAHGAGLIHRDIKPDNVMIGSDGRVRVMDFGLAHGRGAAMTEPELTSTLVSGENPRPTPTALALPLTAVGAVQGTPAYMAPEQWRGLKEEYATDQFAWSVMAWELLYGERPFAAETTVALADAVRSGQRRPPPRGRSVPAWLRRTLERGLATEPAQRWPTMAALLSALERGKTRARLRTAAAALAGVALLGVGAESYGRWDRAERVAICESQGAEIDQAWNDYARQHLREVFAATGVSYAATSAEKIMPWLDARAAEWKQARTDVCLNADVHRTWNEDLVDRAKWCLEDRQMDLELLVDEFGRADATIVQKAVVAAAGLKTAKQCLDENMLLRQPTLPTHGSESFRGVRIKLSRAQLLSFAGNYKEALTLATQAREQAALLGWLPLLAAARTREGWQHTKMAAYEAAEEATTEAYFEAVRSAAWSVAGIAAVNLVGILAQRAQYEKGRAWARHAEAVIAQTEDRSGLAEASRLANLARLNAETGAYSDAVILLNRALAIDEQWLGPGHPDVALSLNSLAANYMEIGDYEKAHALFKRALSIREGALGPDHPDVAETLINLGVLHDVTGAYAEAVMLFLRALHINERALGREHLSVAQTLINLAAAQGNLGVDAEAKVSIERALAIFERTLGPRHPAFAMSLTTLATLHKRAGEYTEARSLNERALTIFEQALGPVHPNVGLVLLNLANLHVIAGAYAEAKFGYARALTIWEQALGPVHPNVALTLSNLAIVLLHEKRPREALQLIERAIPIYDSQEGVQPDEWEAHFSLAKALFATSGAPARVLIEARKARAGFRAEGASKAKELAEVEQWLTEHESALAGADADNRHSTFETSKTRDEVHSSGNGKAKLLSEAEQWLPEDRNHKQ